MLALGSILQVDLGAGDEVGTWVKGCACGTGICCETIDTEMSVNSIVFGTSRDICSKSRDMCQTIEIKTVGLSEGRQRWDIRAATMVMPECALHSVLLSGAASVTFYFNSPREAIAQTCPCIMADRMQACPMNGHCSVADAKGRERPAAPSSKQLL